jgi:hypothetical protein
MEEIEAPILLAYETGGPVVPTVHDVHRLVREDDASAARHGSSTVGRARPLTKKTWSVPDF